MAREIHRNSSRNKGNFVILDSSRINIDNFDENIFGILKRGQVVKGHLEKANDGTLFIDNVNDLPLDVQNKILRVITDQRFKRLNDTTDVTVNFRLIASTSVDLKNEVLNGNFREDLFHRINVINLNLPALIDRLSDIPLLIEYFFQYLLEIITILKNLLKIWILSIAIIGQEMLEN